MPRRNPPLSPEAAAAVAEICFPIFDSHHHVWSGETEPRSNSRYVGLDFPKLGFNTPPRAPQSTGAPRPPGTKLFVSDDEARKTIATLTDRGMMLVVEDYTWQDLVTDIEEAGVAASGTVYLEAGWTDVTNRPDETSRLQAIFHESGGRVASGIQGFADMLKPTAEFEDELRAHMAHQNFRGIRWRPELPNGQFVTFDPAYLEHPHVRANVGALERLGLVWDVWYKGQKKSMTKMCVLLCEIARQHPTLTIVLDHFLTPVDVAKDDECFEMWKDCMQRFSRVPNFYVKVSGLMIDLGFEYHRQLRETGPFAKELASNRWGDLVRYTLDLFGPNRSLFGSNFPVDGWNVAYGELLASYWIICKEKGYTHADMKNVFSDTARRIYKIEQRNPRANQRRVAPSTL
ncbi:amidohydrolase 2 [Gonapodya prolifera JEL478]|uniref:Amidohydrolase 2 n=1 Tax=Gonapodya prolifera (strain JEL478) TaxID=1344416 RepID=A0A139B0D5_GONPJ|nr:amidohydrolase 2 [Gonapodya prolifera JEL478]|eukprot:KXS22458.1 amidohydrolase 2 [Gonapodya prolifera JEL478]